MKSLLITLSLLTCSAQGTTFEGKVDDWKKDSRERFTNPEATFKLVMKKLLEKYVDRDVTEEELYRAATAGMLASLNSGKKLRIGTRFFRRGHSMTL